MISLDVFSLFVRSLGPAWSSGAVIPLARRLRSGQPANRPRGQDTVLGEPRPRDPDPAPEGAPAKAEPRPWDAPSWWWREGGRPGLTARDDVTP